jgi:phage terminase Nu1 subunit (DNA packaging protein)
VFDNGSFRLFQGTFRGFDMATAAQAAKHLFISPSRFRDLVSAGTITHQPSGAYVLDTVREQYIRHAQLVMSGRGAEGGVAALSTQRARLAEAQTHAALLKNAITSGDYVSVAVMERELTGLFGSMREIALGLPGKTADRLQPHSALDRGEIRDVLHAEVCEMLEALSEPKALGAAIDPKARVDRGEERAAS